MLSEKIKARRNTLGMSQKRLAELCGIAQSSISRYEAGDDEITLAVLLKIAKALECPPLYLVEEEFLAGSKATDQQTLTVQKTIELRRHLKQCLELIGE